MDCKLSAKDSSYATVEYTECNNENHKRSVAEGKKQVKNNQVSRHGHPTIFALLFL